MSAFVKKREKGVQADKITLTAENGEFAKKGLSEGVEPSDKRKQASRNHRGALYGLKRQEIVMNGDENENSQNESFSKFLDARRPDKHYRGLNSTRKGKYGGTLQKNEPENWYLDTSRFLYKTTDLSQQSLSRGHRDLNESLMELEEQTDIGISPSKVKTFLTKNAARRTQKSARVYRRRKEPSFTRGNRGHEGLLKPQNPKNQHRRQYSFKAVNRVERDHNLPNYVLNDPKRARVPSEDLETPQKSFSGLQNSEHNATKNLIWEGIQRLKRRFMGEPTPKKVESSPKKSKKDSLYSKNESVRGSILSGLHLAESHVVSYDIPDENSDVHTASKLPKNRTLRPNRTLGIMNNNHIKQVQKWRLGDGIRLKNPIDRQHSHHVTAELKKITASGKKSFSRSTSKQGNGGLFGPRGFKKEYPDLSKKALFIKSSPKNGQNVRQSYRLSQKGETSKKLAPRINLMGLASLKNDKVQEIQENLVEGFFLASIDPNDKKLKNGVFRGGKDSAEVAAKILFKVFTSYEVREKLGDVCGYVFPGGVKMRKIGIFEGGGGAEDGGAGGLIPEHLRMSQDDQINR